jgi:hypothetical protein
MRLSLLKGARAASSSAARQEIRVPGWAEVWLPALQAWVRFAVYCPYHTPSKALKVAPFTARLNRLRKKCHLGWKGVPQRLKPDSLQSIYVRPEGRTLRKHEFFRKLFSRAVEGLDRPRLKSESTQTASFSAACLAVPYKAVGPLGLRAFLSSIKRYDLSPPRSQRASKVPGWCKLESFSTHRRRIVDADGPFPQARLARA